MEMNLIKGPQIIVFKGSILFWQNSLKSWMERSRHGQSEKDFVEE